jgi:hypothetical protein
MLHGAIPGLPQPARDDSPIGEAKAAASTFLCNLPKMGLQPSLLF